MIKRLIILCILFCYQMYAQQTWQYVGNASGISDGTAWKQNLEINSQGVPYVAYLDLTKVSQITVLRYDGSNWVAVGITGIPGTYGGWPSFAISNLGVPYIAFEGFTSSGAAVYKFDGSSWVKVGNIGAAGGGDGSIDFAISPLGVPYISIQNQNYLGIGQLTVLSFNGSTWQALGNSITVAGHTSLAISPNGIPYIAYSDSLNGYKTTVMSFNGTGWIPVGNPGISIGRADDQNIVISPAGVPYVAYIDIPNGSKITVLSFNGINWTPVGNVGFSAGEIYHPKLCINIKGEPYVAYIDVVTGNKITVMSYKNGTWGIVGNPGMNTGSAGYQSLKYNSITDELWITYCDLDNGSKTLVQKIDQKPCITITSQTPSGNADFAEGNNVALGVVATGTNLTYKWKKNGSYIAGATSSTYSIPSVAIADAGVYICEVSNPCATSILSQPINLSVNISPQYKVTAWGGNTAIQNVPAGLTGSKAIVSGLGHAAALKSDGTVAVWGVNDNGMLNMPAGLTGVKAIAAQGFQTIVAKNDGSVVQWGFSGASVPAGLTGVTAVSAGNAFGVALKSNGTVVTWGDNTLISVAAGLTNVKAISAGASHIIALKNDGSVVAWGDNTNGQVTGANGVTGVKSISARAGNTTLFMLDGTVRQFGGNVYTGITSSTNLKDVSSNLYHTLAIGQNGLITGYGGNYFGEINIPAGLASVRAVSAGGYANSSAPGGYANFSMALYLDNLMSGGGSHCSGTTPPPVYINLAGVAPWSVTYTEDAVTKTVNNIQYSPYTVPLASNNAVAHTYQLVSVTDGIGTKAVSASISTNPIVIPAPVITSQSPAAGNVSICSTTPYTLSIVASGATSYQWRKNGVYIVGANSNSYVISNSSPSNSGTYDCLALAACSTQAASSPVVLTVQQIPTVATPSDDWKSATGLTALTAGSDVLSAVSDWYGFRVGAGTYVYLGQSTANGGVFYCARSALGRQFKVVTYAPGCSTQALINYYTGIDNNPARMGAESELSTANESYLYPNPANSSITINSNADKLLIGIFNMLGSEVLAHTILKGEAINIESLSNGVYLVKINDGEDTIFKKLEIIK